MSVVEGMSVKVVSVAPSDSARDAILRMLEEEVGSVAVCDGQRLVGIFTERDVLRLAGAGVDFDATAVGDVMTHRLFVVEPDDDIVAAAHLMQQQRIRHLPVVQGGNLLGILGVREVLRALVERLWSAHDENAHDTTRELLRRGA